jgi:hypothetical protein
VCERIALDPSSEPTLGAAGGASPAPCDAGAAAPAAVEVSFVPVDKKESGRTLEMRIPKLGVVQDVGGIGYCDGVARGSTMTVQCSFTESGSTFHLEVRDGALHMSEESHSYDGDWARTYPPVPLRCGASVRWSSFEYYDPKWHGVGSDLAEVRCMHRCEVLRTKHPEAPCACAPASVRKRPR